MVKKKGETCKKLIENNEKMLKKYWKVTQKYIWEKFLKIDFKYGKKLLKIVENSVKIWFNWLKTEEYWSKITKKMLENELKLIRNMKKN